MMAKIVFKWEILMPSGKVFDAGHLTNEEGRAVRLERRT